MKMFLAERPEVVIEVTEERNPIKKMKGLIGTRSLGPGRGLLLKTKQVHTFGMSYPIDVVYLGPEGRVLKVLTLKPFRVGPVILSAKWVLEVAGGEAARLGISPGLVLESAP